MIDFDFDKLKSSLHNILHQMQTDRWMPDYVVGVVPDGIVPAAFIAQYLGVPLNSLHVDLSDQVFNKLREWDDSRTETNCWMADDAIGYQAERPYNILVVLNRNDNAVIDWIRNDWESSNRTKEWDAVWHQSVRFATLVDVLENSTSVSYAAHEIESADQINFIENKWWSK
jgi:hypothetical protein